MKPMSSSCCWSRTSRRSIDREGMVAGSTFMVGNKFYTEDAETLHRRKLPTTEERRTVPLFLRGGEFSVSSDEVQPQEVEHLSNDPPRRVGVVIHVRGMLSGRVVDERQRQIPAQCSGRELVERGVDAGEVLEACA